MAEPVEEKKKKLSKASLKMDKSVYNDEYAGVKSSLEDMAAEPVRKRNNAGKKSSGSER